MRRLFFLFIAFFTINLVYANSKVTFTASAPDAVAVGDQFRLSYTITTQSIRDFRAPSIKGFEVLMGPSRSQQSSTQIINGNVSSSSSITFTYILMANTEGTFSLPGASIVANGNQMVSNSVKIKVLPADKSGSTGGGTSSSSQGRSSSTSSLGNISSKDLFITATASKTNLYEQEAFLLTFKIYTLVTLRNFSNVKLPDFKGFHSQEVKLPNNPKWELEHYNGKNYHTTVYRQFVLFPQQTGKLVIESARFDASIAKAIQSADPFDAFFNGGSNYVEVKKSIVTPKIAINVKSLPSRPADFSGGVGNFSVTSSINSKDVKTNDAITIKLVISGTGNLQLINTPNVKFPENFDVYDPKIDNSKLRLTKEGLSGNKVIEYLAIPRDPGTFTIPATTFSFFDPKTKTYKTLKTKDYEIKVAKGAGNASQVIADFTKKEDIKVLGEDIRYIKLGNDKLVPKGSYMFSTFNYWLFYIIPIILFIILFVLGRKQIKENANVAKMRIRKANKVATKRMKRAEKLLTENKKEVFYDEVLKALWGYISDKLSIPVSLLSRDNVEDALNNYGVDEILIKELLKAIDECEFARYAPSNESQTMDKVYSNIINVISRLEGSIKH